MPLNSKLLESYGSVHTNLSESNMLKNTKEKVLSLFRSKAQNGVITAGDTNFTEDMVMGALDTCGDEDTVNDFMSFLGLSSKEAIAEAATGSIPPEQVGESVRAYAEDGSFERVVIISHYGNIELPVSEVWNAKDTLFISVNVPENL